MSELIHAIDKLLQLFEDHDADPDTLLELDLYLHGLLDELDAECI